MDGVTNSPSPLQRLLENLAGQHCDHPPCIPPAAAAALSPGGTGLGWSQFNELLLLCGFDRVSSAFFQFLVNGKTEYQAGAAIASLAHLAKAVEQLQSVALLRFGNVKFGFKTLSSPRIDLQEQIAFLKERPTSDFGSRHDPIVPVEPIPSQDTYLLGYLAARLVEERLRQTPNDPEVQRLAERRNRALEAGKANHKAYLVSDHLDVYVATSMRQPHEFVSVSKSITRIFEQSQLASLRPRWFDPTQAYCEDRIDKGLAEALMLRRADCTIYMVQETDTLGKDSELASTLAQGKPVIAFVPEVDSKYAERLLDEIERAQAVKRGKAIVDQLKLFAPDLAWTDAEVRGWATDPTTVDVERGTTRLQTAVKNHYDTRANTLKSSHPLAIQVNLLTGVANGVLVVRTEEDCAQLVYRVLTSSLKFEVQKAEGNRLELRELISGSVFRVATGDALLSNAFWNFYLRSTS